MQKDHTRAPAQYGYARPPNHSQLGFGAAAPVQEDLMQRQLDEATRRLHLDRPTSKYNDVRVLFLQWKDDDLGVDKEVQKLEELLSSSKGFNFSTYRWSIPGYGDEGGNPEKLLALRCFEFREDARRDDLLIIYYAGHAGGNSHECIWAANSKRESPTLNWHNVQNILFGYDAHVLFISDCCFATLAARNHGIGDNWMFGASTKENPTTGVAWNSFTSTLTRELERAADRYWRKNETFSVQSLDYALAVLDRDLEWTPKLTRLTDRDCPPTDLTPLPYPRTRPRLQSAKSEPPRQSTLQPSSPPIPPWPIPTSTTLPPSNQTKTHPRQEPPTLGVPFELPKGQMQALRIYNLQPGVDRSHILHWFEVGLGQPSVISKIGPICWESSSTMTTVVTFTSVSIANQAIGIRLKAFPWMGFDLAFNGLTSVYDNTQGRPKDRTVDVVLVHGLHGHAINSFASHYSEPPEQVLWPRDSLVTELETAGLFPRVMTYGWDALHWLHPQYNVPSIHEYLAEALKSTRINAPERPLIFVAHGVGGFLVKQFVNETINSGLGDRHFENPILACFFLAVPHPLDEFDMGFAECLANMNSVLQYGRPPSRNEVKEHQSRISTIYHISRDFGMICDNWAINYSNFKELLSTGGHMVVPEYLVDVQLNDQEISGGVKADHKGIANLNAPETSKLVMNNIRKVLCKKLGLESLLKPRPVSKERVFARLKGYDTRFLVDDSDSMAGRRWKTTKLVLEKIASIAVEYDKDGVDVRFFNEPLEDDQCMHLNTKEKVMSLFDNNSPDGDTPTADKLEQELNEYIHDYRANRRLKGLNLIVLTDGEPSLGQDVESVIVKYARKLAELEAPPLQVGVQFVQIGGDKKAADFLRGLDDDLKSKHNLDRDMVDTVPWVEADEGRLCEKILLGGILKRLDNDEE